MPSTYQSQRNAAEHGSTCSYIGTKHPESARYSLKHIILTYPESIPVACVARFANFISCVLTFLFGENAFIPEVIIVIIATSTCGCCEFVKYPLIQFIVIYCKW
jgi:hypothetical protein